MEVGFIMTAKRLLSTFIALLLISVSMNTYGLSTELENELKDSVILVTNSNRAYANNTETFIDTSNRDVKSLVINGRTLIPLRFVAESFGAEVSFDSKTSTATITANGVQAKFTSKNKTMLVGDKKIPMDEPAQIINNRMFIPLRALAENALGKNVFYDKGLIIISEVPKKIDPKKVDELIVKFSNYVSPFAYQLSKPVKGDMIAVIKTNYGDIKIKLFYDDAPMAVENFVKLSQNGYYKDVIFHRVINEFMIQGGDPTGTGMGGQSIWGVKFNDEISDRCTTFAVPSLWQTAVLNTNGSQFFIVQNSKITDELKENFITLGIEKNLVEEYSTVGGTPWLDGNYSIFGQVYEGMDVVDKIAAVKTGANDKPVDEIKIITVDTFKLGYEGPKIVFEKSAYNR